MRRPVTPVAVALLLSLLIAAPSVAADPLPAASASPSALPAESVQPGASAWPEPSATADPDPTPPATDDASGEATPVPTHDPDAAPSPAETPATTPVATPDADSTPDSGATPGVTPAPDSGATPAPSGPTVASDAPAEVPTDAQGRPIPDGRYIVVLDPTASTAEVATRHRQRAGIRVDRRFDRAVRAYAAALDPAQRRALLADPDVQAVVPDEVVSVTAQINPTGVSRIGARQSTIADIDNIDTRVNADVAIVDTGVDPSHPDLNVVGGVNCSTSDRSAWRDDNGHGTHVAGTVAALDNDAGVVGVAPGARIWAVRILNADGYGLLSWYVCGLDWIAAQRDGVDPSRPLIEAVNMSVAKSGSDDLACGTKNSDVLHQAICRVTGAGITVVAAAANDHRSAANYVPAAYNEAITVSALADTDGRAGGLGGPRCLSWGTYDVDDTFADFSNYGSDIDVIAPGKCIYSTLPGNRLGYSSGTSMAAPAVTGAVALYKASRPHATPAEVRESLRYLGNLGWAVNTDPDSVHEPHLDVSRIGVLGSFSMSSSGSSVEISARGGSATIPVSIVRGSTFFERVRLSVLGLPNGWTARLAHSSLMGWSASSTSVALTVPGDANAGTYQFKVVGTNWGRTRSTTITVEVAPKAPFTDTSAFLGSIDWLYAEGITGGCSPTTFCPKDPVTRIQMAMFLTRALDLSTTTTDYFDDDDGRTGESSVNAMRKAGLTGGCGPRRYCPTDKVTRIQMAMFLTRVLELPTTSIDYFDDDDGLTGESSVNAMAKAGLTAGCGTRRYCPTDSLSREQMAALLYRALAD